MIQIKYFHKFLIVLGVALACTISLSSEASTLIESFKEKNELIGPVHTAITKHRYFTTTDSYDPSGNLIERVFDDKDSSASRSKYIFTYDDQGLPKEVLHYGDDGGLVSRKLLSFSFHEDGKPAAMVAATDDGSYNHSEFWIYDNRGNLAERIFFTGGDFVDKSIFDVQGKVIYAIRYRGNVILFESVKHYNFKGELVESLYYKADGSLSRKDQYKYDEAGRQIEESSDFYKHYFGLRKSLTRYEFDTYGNWVRQTVEQWADKTDITKPVPAEVIQERIIRYY
jgi:hypothetical protein